MNIENINGKYYQELDVTQLESKLEQLNQQKLNIDYEALEEEYKSNVDNMKQYEYSLDKEIIKLEKVLNRNKW